MKDACTAVVEVVASREGVAPTELPRPLYDVVDPDGLDALLVNESVVVSFEYIGYEVTVTGRGDVDVEPLP